MVLLNFERFQQKIHPIRHRRGGLGGGETYKTSIGLTRLKKAGVQEHGGIKRREVVSGNYIENRTLISRNQATGRKEFGMKGGKKREAI